MRKSLWVLALVSGLASAPRTASACSCMEMPFEMAHEQAAAIFEARVASITPGEGGLVVAMDVVQTWRAAEHEHVEVVTSESSASCGFPFEAGTSYLVYASSIEGERYSVSLCSRTARMADADGDRALLGSGVVPVDVVDDPASDPAPSRPPPTRAGCASCSVSDARPAPLALALFSALALVVRTRRARSRAQTSSREKTLS